MITKLLHPNTDPTAIAQAAELLRRGEVVGIPTETVYGLAANAYNPEAVARIFAAKGRSDSFSAGMGSLEIKSSRLSPGPASTE